MKIIFLHGLGQNQNSWNETVKLLNCNFDTDCPNLFNTKIKNFTYDNLYKSLENYLSKYKEPINICGLSLGGMLALNYTINNPNKVNSLALIGVQYIMPKRLMQFQNFIFKFIPCKFFNKIGIEKKNVIKLTSSMINLNFKPYLDKIKCPVIVMCGTKDRINKTACINLSKILTAAEYTEITNSTHEVNKNNPQKLAEILNKFYNKIS